MSRFIFMLIIVLSLSVPCQGLSPESQLHSPSLLAEADTDTLMDIIEADMKELVATVRSRFELEILAMLTLQAARPRYPVPQKLLIQIHHYFLTTKDPKFRLHNDPRDEEIGYSMLYLEHLPSKKRIYFKPIFGPHYEERARNIELISRAGLPQCVPTRLVKKTDSNDRSLYYFEIDLSQEEFYPLGEVLERINQQFLVKNTPKAWEVVRPFLRNKIFAAVQEALDSLNSHQLSHGHPHQNNVMIRLSYPGGKRISPLALEYADGKVYPPSLDSLRIEVRIIDWKFLDTRQGRVGDLPHYSDQTFDYSGLKLNGITFTEQDFSTDIVTRRTRSFYYTELEGAGFIHCILPPSFTGSNLKGSRFVECIPCTRSQNRQAFTALNFNYADISDAVFSGNKFDPTPESSDGVFFIGTIAQGTHFDRARLQSSRFIQTDLARADMEETNIRYSWFVPFSLDETNLIRTDMRDILIGDIQALLQIFPLFEKAYFYETRISRSLFRPLAGWLLMTGNKDFYFRVDPEDEETIYLANKKGFNRTGTTASGRGYHTFEKIINRAHYERAFREAA